MSMSVTGRRTVTWVSRRRCRGQQPGASSSFTESCDLFGYISQVSAADLTPKDYLNYFVDRSLTTRSFFVLDVPAASRRKGAFKMESETPPARPT